MAELNWLAIAVGAVAMFVVGGIWYSPALFGRAWQREVGLSDEQIQARSAARVFGLAFLLALLASVVFAMFLGPRPGMALATGAGFAAGSAWVGASLGIIYLFESRSLRLFLINAGYVIVAFTCLGAVLGAIR